MNWLACIVPLVVGFYMLVKAADAFVDAAGRLAVRLGIPPLVVGLTVVALGTSAPEAAISISSSLAQAGEMTIANVLGSNILNVLVIMGVTALVAEVPIARATLRREIPFALGVTTLMVVLCLHDGMLGRVDALVLLALLGAYIVYLVRTTRAFAVAAEAGDGVDKSADMDVQASVGAIEVAGASSGFLVLKSAIAIAAIALGANLAVSGATGLAELIGLSERVVGLTVVALGTSLPELVTSVTAARKGQNDVAIGNVVGSCVFNVLFVLGVSGAVAPIPFAATLLVDGVVAIAAVALMWLLAVRRSALGRAGGATLLAGYATYLFHAIAN